MEKKMKKYFTLGELCYSKTAEKNNINNIPNLEVIKNLNKLIDNVLSPLREKYKKPILINSGYRCEALNKLVGGVKNSQHLTGCAADIVPQDYNDLQRLFDIAKEQNNFDQLIWEGTWIHISYSDEPRHKVLNLAKS